MRRLRPFIAVAVVTVALCADRAAQAAPTLRPEMTQLAERLVARLTISFSRSTVNLRILPQRRQQLAGAATPVRLSTMCPLLTSQPILGPTQFPLPPPQLI